MCKHIVTLAFVLSLVFASCDTPYSVKFREEHIQYQLGEPKVAALIYPKISDRLNYGIYKAICPGKSLKSLEGAVNLMIGSKLAENLASEYSISPANVAILNAFSEFLSQTISDSLSPEALGYSGTKEAMAAAIGTALASDYSCESIEAAAKLYYSYGRDDYVADVCHSKNSLKTLLALFRKTNPTTTLAAISENLEISDGFTNIYLRDAVIGELLREGDVTHEKALLMLVEGLSDLPRCHEVTKDFEEELRKMAEESNPYFFEFYDTLLDFKRNCPLKFSGSVLSQIDEGTLIFTNEQGHTSFTINQDEFHNYIPELPANRTIQLDFSKPLPLKGGDIWVQKPIGPLDDVKLNFNYLMLIPIILIAIYGWGRDKKN